MGLTFTAEHHFHYPFRDVAMGLWHKYPNPHSPHIISVDVVDRSIEPDGTLRTERLIAVRQNAPQWIMRLIGGEGDQYVREVLFFTPSPPLVPGHPPVPPRILMSSVNLSLSSLLTVHEKIRYQPATLSSTDPATAATVGAEAEEEGGWRSAFSAKSTLFKQVADMQAQGSLAAGSAWAAVGRRVESWSVDRFSSNAGIGREGFQGVLEKLFGPPSSPPSSSE